MMNKYNEIAQYYDLIMESGYYNYEKDAQSLGSVINTRKKILEVGVGTGLIVEKLLEFNPLYEITGIDFTPDMLNRSKARLGNRVMVIEGNVLSMDLQDSFDVIYSHGGPVGISQVGNDYHLYSFLPDFEDRVKMLKNIVFHLVNGGLFVLNIQSE